MKLRAQLIGGTLVYNLIRFNQFAARNEGKWLTIEAEKPHVSDEMRGYLFGAVIPFLKRIVPVWQSITDEQVYEVLKKNFNYFEAYNPVTKRNERYGQSVLARSNDSEVGKQFIQEIAGWVAENYAMQLPDPDKYKKWRDSAPLANETYPGDLPN